MANEKEINKPEPQVLKPGGIKSEEKVHTGGKK